MIIRGDARSIPLRDGCVQTVVTSPPYWGLRDYGTGRWDGGDADCDHSAIRRMTRFERGFSDACSKQPTKAGSNGSEPQWTTNECPCGATRIDSQIGLEPTPEAYVATMVAVFREVRRVLKDDGTVWLNLGSSYYGSWGNYGGQNRGNGTQRDINSGSQAVNPAYDGLERWRPPTAGVSKRRAQLCDISDRAQSGLHLSDSISFHLCDGCRAVLPAGRISRNGYSPAQEQEPLSFESNRECMESLPDHLPTSDCVHPADRNSAASLDSLLSPDLEGGPLLASQVSTLLRSSSPHRGDCRHCANCDACLYVLGSATRDSRLCARKADYTRDKDETEQTWRSRMTDMVLSSEAWRYLTTTSLKAKDDVAIPSLVALALRMDGWWLRSDIIWAKPNPMPESVTDRPTRSHEYIFLLSKSANYYYDADAISEESTLSKGQAKGAGVNPSGNGKKEFIITTERRNKRSVWTVNSEPTPEAHFATFPQKLIEPCILAGSRPGDLVFDPFIGSGTTGRVAERLGRRWVGLELSADYIKIASNRTAQLGLGL